MLIKKQEAQKLNDLPKGRELLNRRTRVQTHIPDSKACTLSTIRWKLDYQRLGRLHAPNKVRQQPISGHAG